jgi:hypothetical protein
MRGNAQTIVVIKPKKKSSREEDKKFNVIKMDRLTHFSQVKN